MSRFPRTFVKHEQPRATNPNNSTSIYCRRCGREIIQVAKAPFRSVSACQICILKDQGVLNPEDAVLTQYTLSADHNRLPVAIPTDEEIQGGVMMLYPEEVLEETGTLPSSGGVVGTMKAIFRAFGFARPKKEIEKEQLETTPSLQRARSKRPKGLFEE